MHGMESKKSKRPERLMTKQVITLAFLITLYSCTNSPPNNAVRIPSIDTISKTRAENIIISNIKGHSQLLKDSILRMSSLDMKKLTPLDTIVLEKLKKFRSFNSDSCGCTFWAYYYGYLENSDNYLSVVFGRAELTDGGDEQLVLAHLDKNGIFTDAIDVAGYADEAECKMTEKTILRTNAFQTIFKQECAVLKDGENIGESVDSTIFTYTISNTGRSILKDQKKGRLEILDK
jgi:hypothetical protein